VGFWKNLENKIAYKQHYPGTSFRKLYLEIQFPFVTFVESQNCKRNSPKLLRNI